MQTIASIAVEIFLIGFIGFVLRKKKKVSREFVYGLNSLLISIIAPCAILSSGNYQFSSEVVGNLLIITGIMLCYYIFVISITSLMAGRLSIEKAEKSAFINLSVFPNVGFIGFPIILELYGDEGVLYVVVANLIYNLLIYSYGVFNISMHKKMNIKQMLKSPLVITSLAGVTLFLSPVRIPSILMGCIDAIALMVAPVSILILGFELAEYPIREIFKNKHAYLVSFLRLVGFPLLVLIILHGLGISPFVSAVCIIILALPPGTMNVILSKQYNCAPEFSAQTTIQGNVLMVVTLPLIMMLTYRVLG